MVLLIDCMDLLIDVPHWEEDRNCEGNPAVSSIEGVISFINAGGLFWLGGIIYMGPVESCWLRSCMVRLEELIGRLLVTSEISLSSRSSRSSFGLNIWIEFSCVTLIDSTLIPLSLTSLFCLGCVSKPSLSISCCWSAFIEISLTTFFYSYDFPLFDSAF